MQDELSKAFAAFGYEILQALVTDIDPDARVKSAMNEVGGCVWVGAGGGACNGCGGALRLLLSIGPVASYSQQVKQLKRFRGLAYCFV